jgi:hypothetical protein
MIEFTLQYSAVIWVTILYIILYYLLMVYGLVVKMKILKRCKAEGVVFDRYSQQYPELFASDRMQLNTLEHMPPFLVLMWLNALVVGPHSATILGSIYLVLRILYPFFMGYKLKNLVPLRLFINTFSGYAVLLIMVIGIVIELLAI